MPLERVSELLRRAGLGSVDPRVAVGVACACVAGLGWAAWRWLPAGETIPLDAGVGPGAVASSEPTETAQAAFVHVVGAVGRPGVYELPPGSRVRDAVDVAGGLTASAAPEGLNLARLVQDGEQLRVPTVEEMAAQPSGGPGAPAAGGPGGASAAGGLVDLNTADAALLDTLPGVGPSTAQKIVDDREKNGPFKTVEDLLRIPGIGEKKLESLRDLVSAG